MDILLLIGISLTLGLIGLLGFLWGMKHGMFDDPEGTRYRNPSLYPTELRVQGEEASIVLVFERFPLDAGSIKRIPISGKAFSPLIRNPDP